MSIPLDAPDHERYMLKTLNFIAFTFIITALAGCQKDAPTATPAAVDARITISGATEQGHFFVEITPSPAPIPFQELFALDVRVLDADKKPLSQVAIDDVRAIMPSHKHGMNVKPEITDQGDGKFHVEGMRFHMRGDGDDGLWVIELVINHQGVIDQTAFEVQCCTSP